MAMREKLLEYAPVIKRFRAGLGERDMRPLIYVEHEGQLVCTVFAGPNGKAEMLNAIVTCGAGMDASALTFAFDAKFHIDTPSGATAGEGPINPVTGQPWRPGEMQALAEDGAADALGIRDAICLVRIERGSDNVEGLSLPYRIAAGTVDYLPTDWESDETAHNMEGTFAEALREAMTRETLSSVVARNPLAQTMIALDGLTAEESVVHQRCVVLKALMAQHFPVILEPHSEAEIEVYCRSLGVTREDFEKGAVIEK